MAVPLHGRGASNAKFVSYVCHQVKKKSCSLPPGSKTKIAAARGAIECGATGLNVGTGHDCNGQGMGGGYARAWGGGYGKGMGWRVWQGHMGGVYGHCMGEGYGQAWVECMGIAWVEGMGRAWHGEILHVLADKRGMAEWLLCWLRQAVG